MTTAIPELGYPSIRWDLSVLFNGLDDPALEHAWAKIGGLADEFEQKYRGKITGELGAKGLHDAIFALENIVTELSKPLTYANLIFAADAAKTENGAFLQSQMERATSIKIKVLFFELELQKMSQGDIDLLLRDPVLEPYRHYITVARNYTPHMLSEVEEVLLEETANTGVRAWERLFEEVTSNHEYEYKNPATSEIEMLSQEELLVRLRDADREVRAATADAFTKGLKQQSRVLIFIYNTILQDKRTNDRLRNHPFPEHGRHLSNELDAETVDLVVNLCAEFAPLVARYYDVKKQILGLNELTHIDRYAPLFEAEETVPYDRAKTMVLDAFRAFTPELSDRASEFFEKKWIDAEPRNGKTGGAFCSYCTPDTHPFILMSYTNRMRDVSTLAHELGHGVHASLSRQQSQFNFHGTLPLAELASIFGEMLVFEDLVRRASDKDKVALYAKKIEDTFASVFRQAAMYRFEKRSHRARQETGELSAEEFGDIWQEEMQAMFGSSVHLGEDHRWWWMYVGHFFEMPFYVYAYAFGELLSLSVYRMANGQGPDFVTNYIDLLKLGGSKSPQELMATIGVDLSSREFWLGGMAEIERMLTEFERLWSEHDRN